MSNFRLSLTIWFVVLSSIVYIILGAVGFAAFRASISDSIDEELRVLASEFGHAVDLDAEKPRFRDWARTLKTDPVRGLATIQLYDSEGRLLEEFGPKAERRLYKKIGEMRDGSKNYRVSFTPLTADGKVVGYLQFELSAASRDQSLERLLLISLLLGPCVVLGLGLSSYYVAGLAARPLQENLENMRRFIADAGHELNTPLSIVRAKTESLERKLHEPLSSELTASVRALGRMEAVVENLMYLSELDARTLKREDKEVVDLTWLCAQIVDDFEMRYEDKGIALTLDAGEPISVLVERDSLYRAISNLVENAWRYTESGSVRVGCHRRGDKVEVVVADTGIGVPSESRQKIFERFYRVDRSRSRQSGGVGLGLSIVKAIAEKHGGSVALESHGQGSTFILTLPREPVGVGLLS